MTTVCADTSLDPATEPVRPAVVVPPNFPWTEGDNQKLAILARKINCTLDTARHLLAYFLRYIEDNPRGLAVAHLPQILAPFPVKWGYKKKRNDFFKLLHDLDYIYVEVNYWAKIRAKKYALAPGGRDLMDRLAASQAPPVSPAPPAPPDPAIDA